MSQDLARRAVACPGWRWMPGMRWTGSLPENAGRLGEVFRPVPAPVGLYLPDLTDPATVGCLLALVREAYGDKEAFVRCGVGWVFCTLDPMAPRIAAPTEAEALVAALEAAP